MHIMDILKQVKYPGFSRDIVSFGLVQQADFKDGVATVKLKVTTQDEQLPQRLKTAVEEKLRSIELITHTEVTIDVATPQIGQATYPTQRPPALSKVRFVVAIASGKGGVGKSTVAVHLACALSEILKQEKKAVGIMDCDIYGPSIPLMLGLSTRPDVNAQSQLIPLENFGIQLMSMGLLIDEHAPVVWRGPMVTKTIQQFANSVAWGNLEVLIVDLPPGTGDAQLTLAQTIPLDGAIIVTTPQPAAFHVATRGAMMFEKVQTPILGVIENMSYFLEPHSGQKLALFGDGGGQACAEALATPLLGQIPLDPQMRQGADWGIPIVLSHPESEAARVFFDIAKRLLEQLSATPAHLSD